MFKLIKSWFKKSQNRPKYTTFTIAVEPEYINVTADWADPKNISNQELVNTAKRTAITLLSFCQFGGAGLAELKRAIGRTAEHRQDQMYANSILGYMDMMEEQNFSMKYNSSQSESLVSPLKTFENF